MIGQTDRVLRPSRTVVEFKRLSPEASRKEWGTLFLATLSALTLAMARSEASTSLPWLAGINIVFVGVPWLVWLALQFAKAKIQVRFDRLLPLVVASWGLLPIAVEMVLRWLGVGEPLEIIMLCCAQNLTLALAVYSHLPRCRQISTLFSGFLALFAVAIGTSAVVLILAGAFGVGMLWWMMARYWERIQRTIVAGHTTSCMPMRSSILFGTLGISAAAFCLLGSSNTSTFVLAGFLPTSGGDRWSSEYARAGVGNGDAMVAAKDNAMSFGPVESELFLDSEMPTLYDMFDDMYGEPVKPKKLQRSIAIAPTETKSGDQPMAKTERSGREFSLLRRRTTRKQNMLKERAAPAMFYLLGRVPLHLAIEHYDRFDGRNWTHSGKEEDHPPICIAMQHGKPWANLVRLGASTIHRGTETHTVKLINFKSNRFAAPPHLSAIHIDRLDQADFFGWTKDGHVFMPVREHIPRLTVIHLQSQGANLESLRINDFTTMFDAADIRRQSVDVASPDKNSSKAEETIAELANEWTRDVPRGWLQVEAIVSRLREEFTVDTEAVIPEDAENVVAHFLKTKRGPSYLFATTAASMLQKLGYSARFVTGFYAQNERYERRSGQTSVLSNDVHVWAEVRVDDQTWVPIEPTPGYEPPRETLTWQQYIAQSLQAFGDWLGRHLFLLLAVAIFVTLAVLARVLFIDFAATLICRLAGGRNVQRRVLWTMRLLEWRARLAGRYRPQTTTLTHWHRPLLRLLPAETSASLQIALQAADSLLYAPPDSSLRSSSPDLVTAACAIVDRDVTVRCFQGLAKSGGRLATVSLVAT